MTRVLGYRRGTPGPASQVRRLLRNRHGALRTGLALSSACVALLVLGLGGTAHAGGKPPIAILGLEVYDNGSGIDPETTRAAKELTAALRDRAKAGTGPYTP